MDEDYHANNKGGRLQELHEALRPVSACSFRVGSIVSVHRCGSCIFEAVMLNAPNSSVQK